MQKYFYIILTVLTGAGGGGPRLLLSNASCFFSWFCILLKLVLFGCTGASAIFGLIAGTSGVLGLLLRFGCGGSPALSESILMCRSRDTLRVRKINKMILGFILLVVVVLFC